MLLVQGQVPSSIPSKTLEFANFRPLVDGLPPSSLTCGFFLLQDSPLQATPRIRVRVRVRARVRSEKTNPSRPKGSDNSRVGREELTEDWTV